MSEQPFNHRLLRDGRFAIVDAHSRGQLPPGLDTALPSRVDAPLTPLLPTALASNAHLLPSLLQLGLLTRDERAALLQAQDAAQTWRTAPPLTLFVETAADAQGVTRHWNMLQTHRTAQGQLVWMRVHDSRVLHQLLRILSPAQQTRLFGPITAFIYWLGGEWLRAEQPAIAPSGDGAARWDWLRVEQIGLVNRALARAGVQAPASITAQADQAEQLIQHAQAAHRLSAPADLVEFASRGLACRSGFDQEPAVSALLQPDDEGESTLADRWALLDPAVWSALALRGSDQEQEAAP